MFGTWYRQSLFFFFDMQVSIVLIWSISWKLLPNVKVEQIVLTDCSIDFLRIIVYLLVDVNPNCLSTLTSLLFWKPSDLSWLSNVDDCGIRRWFGSTRTRWWHRVEWTVKTSELIDVPFYYFSSIVPVNNFFRANVCINSEDTHYLFCK